MTAIVYPDTLPTPSVATTTSAERRALAPDGGPFDARALQRDRLAMQQITFPPFTAAEAAIFRAWWRDELLRGGAMFSATWPLPQGYLAAVRQWIGVPKRQRTAEGFWQVSGTVEVSGVGMPPDDYVPSFGTAAFFTPSSLDADTALVLSNGDLTATHPDGGKGWMAAEIANAAGDVDYSLDGKRYFEIHFDGPFYMGATIGFITRAGANVHTTNPYGAPNSVSGFNSANLAGLTPGLITAGVQSNSSAYAAALFSTVMVAVEASTGKVWYGLNGAWIGDPALGTGEQLVLPDADFMIFVTTHDSLTSSAASGMTAHLSDDMMYAAPDGFKPWNQVSP